VSELLNIRGFREKANWLGMVMHTCNLIYQGRYRKKDLGQKPATGKKT
jgi:hypothetical protein